MEVVGVIASAAQISVYALNIVSTIHEVRQQLKNGSSQSEERIKYLEVLCATIHTIENNPVLHTDQLAAYLFAIQVKITRLKTVLVETRKKLKKTPLRRIWFTLATIRAEKLVVESFSALDHDCNSLNLYLTASRESRDSAISASPRVASVAMPVESNVSQTHCGAMFKVLTVPFSVKRQESAQRTVRSSHQTELQSNHCKGLQFLQQDG
jgi:hypothetical protein